MRIRRSSVGFSSRYCSRDSPALEAPCPCGSGTTESGPDAERPQSQNGPKTPGSSRSFISTWPWRCASPGLVPAQTGECCTQQVTLIRLAGPIRG